MKHFTMNWPFPLTDYYFTIDKNLTLQPLVFSHMGTQTQLSKSVTFTNTQESRFRKWTYLDTISKRKEQEVKSLKQATNKLTNIRCKSLLFNLESPDMGRM